MISIKYLLWTSSAFIGFIVFGAQAADDFLSGTTEHLPAALSALTAFGGGVVGVRTGISKLRSQQAFTSRLEWYQKAATCSLQLRFALQHFANLTEKGNAWDNEEKNKAWDNVKKHIDTLVQLVPQSAIYARKKASRQIMEVPMAVNHFWKDQPDLKSGNVDWNSLEAGPEFEDFEANLNDLKDTIKNNTRCLTQHLRVHLGLKELDGESPQPEETESMNWKEKVVAIWRVINPLMRKEG